MNKLSPNRQKKEQIVARLTEKVGKAKGVVFTNYQGLTHKQLENLKKKVKTANAELIVSKNTLLLRALEIGNFVSRSEIPLRGKIGNSLQGPTATLFLYGDPIEPLKQLAQSIKQFSLPSIKFGILDNQALSNEQVLKLSTLPSYDILIAQLLYQMKAPIYRLHRALGWNMQKLVTTLKAIEAKKTN